MSILRAWCQDTSAVQAFFLMVAHIPLGGGVQVLWAWGDRQMLFYFCILINIVPGRCSIFWEFKFSLFIHNFHLFAVFIMLFGGKSVFAQNMHHVA